VEVFVLLGGSVFLSLGGGLGVGELGHWIFVQKKPEKRTEFSLASTGLLSFIMQRCDILPSIINHQLLLANLFSVEILVDMAECS